MKKQKKAQKKNWLNRRNIALGLAALVIAGLVSAQLFLNKLFWDGYKRAANKEISGLINDALRGLNKDAVIDGPSRQVYMPDAKLVLPPYPAEIRFLRYNYFSAPGGELAPEVRIASGAIMDATMYSVGIAVSMEDLFSKVPKAQACSRQIQIFFDESHGEADGNLKRVVKKPLADGRIARIYLDQECPDDSEQLINYLKQIESY